MHKIDRVELLANVGEIGKEASALLEEAAMAPYRPRLRRMLVLLRYMREHLEMVSPAPQENRRKAS